MKKLIEELEAAIQATHPQPSLCGAISRSQGLVIALDMVKRYADEMKPRGNVATEAIKEVNHEIQIAISHQKTLCQLDKDEEADKQAAFIEGMMHANRIARNHLRKHEGAEPPVGIMSGPDNYHGNANNCCASDTTVKTTPIPFPNPPPAACCEDKPVETPPAAKHVIEGGYVSEVRGLAKGQPKITTTIASNKLAYPLILQSGEQLFGIDIYIGILYKQHASTPKWRIIKRWLISASIRRSQYDLDKAQQRFNRLFG